MDNFKILQWNMRGFFSQKPYLQKSIDTLDPDIICLQETHLKAKNVPSLSKFHFPPIKRDREDRRGGGVMILIKNTINYLKIDVETELEIVTTKVFIQNKPLIICNIYLPPDLSNVYINDQMSKVIADFDAPFLITMDANAHHPSWGSPIDNTDTRGNILYEFIEQNSLVLLNMGDPTYLTSNGNYTHIDITICSPELASIFNWQTHHDPMNSDHFPIIISTQIENSSNFSPRWNIRKANWTKYRQQLDLPEDYSAMTPTQGCQLIINAIKEAANESIPLVTSAPHHPSAYWWTKECDDAKKSKNRCLNRYKKHKGNLNLWIEFKKSRAVFRRAVSVARQESWNKFLDCFKSNVSSTKFWKHLKILQNKPISRTIILKEGDQYITSASDVSEKLAAHFASRSNGIYANAIFNDKKSEAEKSEVIFDSDHEASYNRIISFEEFDHALRTCCSKSPGPDSLPYSFIQNMSKQQKDIILKFFNFIYEKGYPDQWHQGSIIALKKPNKIITAKESYRPITLNNTLSKVMGKIINKRLQQYLESENFFAKNQSGFRASHSTLDGLCRLEHDARMAIMQKKYCVSIFLDISQAFDSVWHHGLLMKIKEIGLNGNLANFIKGFLQDRKITVRIGSHSSSPHKLSSGVPQGSVMSPTLFTILINDIFKELPSNIQHSLFADDGAIWSVTDNLSEALENIQEALNTIIKWTETWGLTLSKEKTVAIIFTSKRMTTPPPPLMLGTHPILYTNTVKFLGMQFDTRLTWANHINQIVAKCQKDVQLLRIISFNKIKSDVTTLKRIYTSLILPKIDYGSIIYAEAAKTHLKKLDSLQISSLKIALGALRSTGNYKIEAEAYVMPLEFRRKELLTKYSYRVGSIENHPVRDFLHSKTPIHTLINNNKIPALYRIFKEFENFPNSPINMPLISMKTKYQTQTLPVYATMNIANKSSLGSHQWLDLFKSMIEVKYKDHKQIFTDGSKQNEKTGSGVWSESFKLQTKLPKYSTVFTAELYAIYAAISFVKNTPGKHIILTDSLSAVHTLQSFNKTSHYLVSWIKDLLLNITNCIKIEWVPSHMCIIGNERADELARGALELTVTNCIPPAKQEMDALIHSHYMRSWQTEWSRMDPSLTGFKPIVSPIEYVGIPRSIQVPLTRLRLLKTQVCIRRFLKNVNQASLTCTNCLVPISLCHIMIDCPAHDTHRAKLIQFFQSSNEVLSLPNLVRPNTPYHLIVEFLKSADLLKIL